MTDAIEALTATTFDEEVRGATVPVVVEFWAEWCGPCKALAPVLESIADDHRDGLRVYKINADDHPDISLRYGVMGLPTMLLFDEGELVKRLVGARGKAHLLEELADVLR